MNNMYLCSQIKPNAMKAEDPMLLRGTSSAVIPHLRSYIINKVENEKDVAKLEQIYAVISAGVGTVSYGNRYAAAKEQTEKYCTSELAEELEAEGYMIDQPYPYDGRHFNFDEAIREDKKDEAAPKEWIEKMFPELNVRG